MEEDWFGIEWLSFRPWGEGKPKSVTGDEDCMNIWREDGKPHISDFSCSARGAGAVCVKPTGQHPECADGWYLYDGKCYTRVLGNFVYKEAKDACDSFKKGSIITAPEHYGVLVKKLSHGNRSMFSINCRFYAGFLAGRRYRKWNLAGCD